MSQHATEFYKYFKNFKSYIFEAAIFRRQTGTSLVWRPVAGMIRTRGGIGPYACRHLEKLSRKLRGFTNAMTPPLYFACRTPALYTSFSRPRSISKRKISVSWVDFSRILRVSTPTEHIDEKCSLVRVTLLANQRYKEVLYLHA